MLGSYLEKTDREFVEKVSDANSRRELICTLARRRMTSFWAAAFTTGLMVAMVLYWVFTGSRGEADFLFHLFLVLLVCVGFFNMIDLQLKFLKCTDGEGGDGELE